MFIVSLEAHPGPTLACLRYSFILADITRGYDSQGFGNKSIEEGMIAIYQVEILLRLNERKRIVSST